MKIIGALFLLTMLNTGSNQVIDNTEAEIKATLDLLHEGDERIGISTPGGENIYVLGPTGSGKSTLVQLLAGNVNLLQSVEIEDSNDFIIKQTSGEEFGSVIFKSKTMYPDLIIDENNVRFYDCPGFSDNSNTSIEIATNYLMKKVINNADNLKIVFVVDYHMLLKGSERNFSQFMKHATQFLRNVKPYSDGILLVASKVPFLQGPDGKLKKKIKGFLKGYRQYISDERNSSEDISNELDLIDTFLTNERITLFKRPPTSGLLSEIPETMENRVELLNSVHRKIKFVQMNGEDFGYTFSDRSKLIIIGLVEEINRRITNIFDQINQRVIDHYSNKYPNYHNIDMVQYEFDQAMKILSRISRNISTSEYLKAMNQLNIPIFQENFVDIYNYIDYLKYLQSVHDQPTIQRLSEWGRSLENSLQYLDNEKNWCRFAKKLFSHLSEFDVQNNTSKYDVEDIERWGLADNKRSGNGIVITHENFNDFLNKFVESRLVGNVKPSISKIELLNYILNITLKSKPISSCYDNKLVVKGTFVKLSDLKKYRTDCEAVGLIEVFALSTIFLDIDLKENVDLVVIAPKWYVAKTDIQINLDGIKGSDYASVSNGNGLPGMPGKNANNFFGYGDDVNAKNLKISAVGGNGGRGQDGSNSSNGQGINIPADGSYGEYLKGYAKPISHSNYDDIGFLYFNRKHWVVETFQSSVHCPGINGIGGSGGIAGSGGTVELNSILSGVEIITANGKVGASGTSGKCGKTYSQVEIHKTTRKACSFWFFCSSKVTWSGGKFDDPKCRKNCQDSTQVNMKGISIPTPAQHLNAAHSVNQYKSFARENLHNMPINREHVETFLRSMEKNAKIRSIYDTKTLIDDFFQIEKQFHILKKSENFSDFYHSLLERILHHVTKRSTDLQVNERRTLANLYTAGLSKICKLRSGTEQSLIIDIESYLDVAMDHIRLVEKTGKQVAIKQFQNEYRRNLEMKMNDTRGIIVMDIVPEIEKIYIEIDTVFENLLDEVLQAKHSVASNIDRYDQAKKEIEDSVILRGTFKFLKVITGIISFFNGFAAVVSTTVNTVNQVAAVFGDHHNHRPSEKISYESFDEFKHNHFQLENSVQLTKQRKSEFLLKIVDNVLTMATGFSFNDILEPIMKVKNILNGDKKVDLTSKEIDSLQVDVRNIIGNKTYEIESMSRRNETNSLRALRKIIKKLSVLEMDVDLFSKFSSDEEKLVEIESAIRHSQERLFDLKNLEQNVLQFVEPFVKYVKDLFNQFPKNFMNQKMSSEVMKGQIQNKLKDLRFHMQQVSSGKLKLEYELLHTIDKLDGTISTLIDIFDRIQIYEEQVKLSNYIANIESADYSTDGLDSSNQDLNNLKVIIQSNVILTIFDNAVNGFKQTIFPFAGFYLHRFDLPDQLLTDTNLETLVKESTQELQNLKMTLKEYRSASINENDNLIHTAEFTNNFKSSQPFYVWSGREHYKIIEKLLSGQAITIKSDITKGLKWNAVKFKNLEIHLKSTNQSEQANLDRFLKYFDVTIVHHGNSYYRCDNKFYLITSPIQCIEYSFEKDDNGLPIRSNNVYNKMRNGDFTLSPYALLTISLTVQKPDKFKSLNSDFIRTVNLELIGRGKYLDPNVDVCVGLEKYYAADELVNDFHRINSF